MFSVEEILSRASVKLAQLKESDSAGYLKKLKALGWEQSAAITPAPV